MLAIDPKWLVGHGISSCKAYCIQICNTTLHNSPTSPPLPPQHSHNKPQVELAPNFFKKADPNHMSKAKRQEKIEPLYDRFNPKDSWRLSKRKG